MRVGATLVAARGRRERPPLRAENGGGEDQGVEHQASCARCLRGGLEHFRGRKPAGRGADGPWNYAGIGM